MVITLDYLNAPTAAADQIRLQRIRVDRPDTGLRRRASDFAEETDAQGEGRSAQAVAEDGGSAAGSQAARLGGSAAFGVAATSRFLAAPELLSAAQFAAQIFGQSATEAEPSAQPSTLAVADTAYRQAQGRAIGFASSGPRVDVAI